LSIIEKNSNALKFINTKLCTGWNWVKSKIKVLPYSKTHHRRVRFNHGSMNQSNCFNMRLSFRYFLLIISVTIFKHFLSKNNNFSFIPKRSECAFFVDGKHGMPSKNPYSFEIIFLLSKFSQLLWTVNILMFFFWIFTVKYSSKIYIF